MLDNNLLKVSSCQAGKRLRGKLAGQEGRAVGEVDAVTSHGPAVASELRGWRSGGPAAWVNRDGQLLLAYGNL